MRKLKEIVNDYLQGRKDTDEILKLCADLNLQSGILYKAVIGHYKSKAHELEKAVLIGKRMIEKRLRQLGSYGTIDDTMVSKEWLDAKGEIDMILEENS